eukprot:CAMPEP_0206271650 /NCGR_PEP_ID=MMETSP0047_2-20121206/33549_1 /ASSEMBLY_ACC=CAM_ASM_000192 /TAXON_ID=195065 /ORGANISM="Chroomonas mesostigmatica_cf, Strain CCMP1168" /LENGTH=268 /DNA_ID=CAMNT_0053700441 /DNA_START=13 /DNA_END=819 /DNA_ORIENTATION=+
MSTAVRFLGTVARRAAPSMTRSLSVSASRASAGPLVSRPAQFCCNPAKLSGVHASGLQARWMSGEAEKKEEAKDEGAKADQAAGEGAGEKKAEEGQKEAASEGDKTAMQLKEKDDIIKKKDEEINELKKRVLTALADVENMRVRMKKQQEEDKKFAARGFAKNMLEVADVLEKALAAVPEDKRKENSDLQTVYEGMEMTERIFLKGLENMHISKYDPMNEKFDPNLHQALFEMPTEEGGEKGMVKSVIKCGYMIHDRVLRPAEVGVTK